MPSEDHANDLEGTLPVTAHTLTHTKASVKSAPINHKAGLVNCDQLIDYRDARSAVSPRGHGPCVPSRCAVAPPLPAAPSSFAPHAIPARLTLASRPPLS
eukprot:2694297-Prymnesium_polylepis.1